MLIPALPIYAQFLVEWGLSHGLEVKWWKPHPMTNNFYQLNFIQKEYRSPRYRAIAQGCVRQNGMLYLGTIEDRTWSLECDLKDPNCLIKLEKWFSVIRGELEN